MKKVIKIMVTLFIAILLFASVLLMNLFYWATNDIFYQDAQVHNRVNGVVNLPQEKINTINKQIIDYLKLKTNDLQITIIHNQKARQIFNDKELEHMRDVRKLFIYGYIFLGISLILLTVILITVLSKRLTKWFKRIVVKIPLILAIFSVVIIAIVLIDFNYWFTIFHKLSFTNELWLLDPQQDLLIQIMPLDFFTRMFIRIVVTTIVSLIAMATAGSIINKLLSRRSL